MIKKAVSLLVCVTILVSSTSVHNAFAKEESDDYAKTMLAGNVLMEDLAVDMPAMNIGASQPREEALEKSLEQAIKATKSKITIPKEYSEFDYFYQGTNSYSPTYWNLSWRKAEEYSVIEVGLDKDYNIVYYSNYDYSKTSRSIPSYLKNELEDEALAFIKKIAPDIYNKLDFIEANYDGIYNNSYTYFYQRKENNVIFPDNTVSVRVDAHTGKVRSANINWLRGVKIPSANAKLTKNNAAKIIGENLNMKLTYKINYYNIFENGQNKISKKAFLVYEPDKGYISVDANTGDIYLTRTEWVEMASGTNNKEMDDKADMAVSEDSGVAGMAALTEEEISKIRELEKLISKDKAIEIVTTNPYLYIDDNLISYTASLNKSYTFSDEGGSYVWNISLRDNRPIDYNNNNEDYHRASAYASVDAKSGKILSFNANIKSNYNRNTGKWDTVKVKYDREYGRKVLEKFLKSQVESRFNKTKLVEERDDYVAYYKEENIPVYGGYGYRYNRFNEDVEFIYNSISGSVDGVTGKIYNYRSNWDDDIVFESPKNAMSPQNAFEHYISKDGFNLLYEINVINQYDPNYKSIDKYYDYSEAYSVAYEIRLVYRPDISPAYISPFTGQQLNSNGEVYKGREPYVYKDIVDSKENREILLLTDMNIGFEGENFNPDKLITEDEFDLLIDKLIGYGRDSSEQANASNKLITREELAYKFIKIYGLEKIASIPGIYTTGYYDENTIATKYLGAVALAKGLEIFPKDDSKLFNPRNNISRRDAVKLLFKFTQVGMDNNY